MGGKFNGRNKRSDAFAMLESCHRRLEQRLDDLLRAAGAVARGRSRATHLDAIAEVLDYLERAAARHEADEEESVFPRLDKRKTGRLVTTLTNEHKMHRKLAKKLRTVFSNFTAEPTTTEGASLLRIASELDAAYRGHIDLEDEQLVPVMRDLLSAQDLSEILSEMQNRRRGRVQGSKERRNGNRRASERRNTDGRRASDPYSSRHRS